MDLIDFMGKLLFHPLVNSFVERILVIITLRVKLFFLNFTNVIKGISIVLDKLSQSKNDQRSVRKLFIEKFVLQKVRELRKFSSELLVLAQLLIHDLSSIFLLQVIVMDVLCGHIQIAHFQFLVFRQMGD